MSVNSFYELEVETNPEIDLDAMVDLFQIAFPGWEPAEGNLEWWIARWVADTKADLAELTADVSGEIFHRFGAEILGLPPVAAVGASVSLDFTLADTEGHVIPEGTQVELAVGDDTYGFATLAEVTVPNGNSVAPDVAAVALVPGAEPNNLVGTWSMIDSLSFVPTDGVDADDPPTGGADAESAIDYRDRLKAELRLLTPRPILPRDAAVMALRVAGVDRALALDGYVPGSGDDPYNERTLTVVVVGEDGADPASGVKADVDELLEDQREINFEFYVVGPTYTTVDVDVEVKARDGFDQDGVEAAVQSTIETYLAPGNWGRPAENDDAPAHWRNQDTVRLYELVALVDNVDSVDYVISVEIAEDGDPTTAADLPLDGPGSLTEPGDVNVTVT